MKLLSFSQGVLTGVSAQWALKTSCTWPWTQRMPRGALGTALPSSQVGLLPSQQCHGHRIPQRDKQLPVCHTHIQLPWEFIRTQEDADLPSLRNSERDSSVTSANPLRVPPQSLMDLQNLDLITFLGKPRPHWPLQTNITTFSKAIANLCATARPWCSIVQRTEASHCLQQVSDGGKGNISTNT